MFFSVIARKLLFFVQPVSSDRWWPGLITLLSNDCGVYVETPNTVGGDEEHGDERLLKPVGVLKCPCFL